MNKEVSNAGTNLIWKKVTLLGFTLFFILISDAILSFWVPNFIEKTFSNPLLMGFIISFSSAVGLLADLVLPQLIRGVTVRKLLLLSIFTSFTFILTLFFSYLWPLFILILTAMAFWGIYYELIGFAQQQFVADSTPLRLHSSVWGILTIFKSSAYFLGPIIASFLLSKNSGVSIFVSLIFLGIGFLLYLSQHKKQDRVIAFDTSNVSIRRELLHWKALFVHVWPVVVLSLFIGLIDSSFWTVGAVYTEKLASQSPAGRLFLPFYALPSLFTGVIISRLRLVDGKKKRAEVFVLLASIALIETVFFNSIYYILFMVITASTLIWLASPLLDAVYSDLVVRMGRERRHLIGLSSSSISVAYIVGPVIAGYLTSVFNEKYTFSIIGIAGVVICMFLLFITPKKLHLPQKEINTWE